MIRLGDDGFNGSTININDNKVLKVISMVVMVIVIMIMMAMTVIMI